MLQLTGVCRDGTGKHCGKPANFRLLGPSGDLVPGCFMCAQHAKECLEEYRTKLGERWFAFDVRTDKTLSADSVIAD